LNLLDMLEVRSYLSDQQDPSWSAASFSTAPAGEEMTRLLAYTAAQLPAGSGVVHIGTSMPYVASMAVYNPGAEVHAFDYYQHHRSACVLPGVRVAEMHYMFTARGCGPAALLALKAARL
jgi:hypothetical protein